MFSQNKNPYLSRANVGFTIVELLIVIVVIGILAAITIVSYTGIQQQAAASTLQSDLKNTYTKLELAKVTDGQYPTDVSDPNDDDRMPKSPDSFYEYDSDGDEYCLTASSDSAQTSFHIDSSTGGMIEEGPCDGHDGYVEGGDDGDDDSSTIGATDMRLGSNYKIQNPGTSSASLIVQSVAGTPLGSMMPYVEESLALLPKELAIDDGAYLVWDDTIVSSKIELSGGAVINGRDAVSGENGGTDCGYLSCPFPPNNTARALWSNSGAEDLRSFRVGSRAYDLNGTGVSETLLNDEIDDKTAVFTLITSGGYKITYIITPQGWPE